VGRVGADAVHGHEQLARVTEQLAAAGALDDLGNGPTRRAITGRPLEKASIRMMPKVSKHSEGTISASAWR
jgi:hypothetical protein